MTAKKPNILWICTDQQRYDTIHALGNEHIRTPNIDKLVETGTAFAHAYCQSPICTPSRTSFLTGTYPSTIHACINGNDHCRFYEGLVRVPLIFSLPNRIEQGLRSDVLVELVDIAPTLLELAGLAVPETMQGKSLLPILEGKADHGRHREFVRSVYYNVLEGPQSYATMIRTREYKLVNYHGHDIGELFDLGKDPYEFDNLWEDPAHADVRFELMKKSFDALAFAVDTGPPRAGRY